MLKAYAAHSGTELAATLGVEDSYVYKLRKGWRPTRVRDELWSRLQMLDPERSAPVAKEQSPPWGGESRDYFRGMQDAALRMMRTVVDLQVEIGAALRQSPDLTPLGSPTAAEIADGLAALDAVDAQKAQAAKRGKRAG